MRTRIIHMSNTGGFNPIAGIGLTPMSHGDESIKKFSSSECLQALLDAIQDDPSLVRNQFNIVSKEQSGEMQTKYWPAIFNTTNWSRLSTHRPKTDEESGEPLTGTDREVREYDNDFWADEGKQLRGYVTTEWGEITTIKVVAKW